MYHRCTEDVWKMYGSLIWQALGGDERKHPLQANTVKSREKQWTNASLARSKLPYNRFESKKGRLVPVEINSTK